MLKLVLKTATAGALIVLAAQAGAADITGAGASFPGGRVRVELAPLESVILRLAP